MNFTVLDIILVIPLLIGLIRGLFRGLIAEIASLAGLVGGLLLAFFLTEDVYQQLILLTGREGIEMRVASFLLVFVFVALVVNQLSKLLTKLIDAIALGMINHLLGGLLGLGKWLVVVLVIVYFVNSIQRESPLFQQSTLEESQVYQQMAVMSQGMSEYIDQAMGYVPKKDSISSPQ
ncbi:MAG: CvpA family protein [Schleiferiaceae bacterium]|jgi:membrane protein required for colicin V production|nr:CvpA family protein [Schleiferiaceae bacterium]MDR9443025.1 CvpA family protein [Schleiferiaceae bacterium]